MKSPPERLETYCKVIITVAIAAAAIFVIVKAFANPDVIKWAMNILTAFFCGAVGYAIGSKKGEK